ncbi:MAG: hypothetical protein ACM3UU_07685 [Ignavibacteriales bacterium]
MAKKKQFFKMFKIETTNKNVNKIMTLLSRGNFEKAGELAQSTLEDVYYDEEAIICYLAIGFMFLKLGNLRFARANFGSASGLSQRDMRLKIEALIAEVYAKIGNDKEAKRRYAPVNGVVLMKHKQKGNTKSILSLREDLERVQFRLNGSKKRLNKKQREQMSSTDTAELFSIPMPF